MSSEANSDFFYELIYRNALQLGIAQGIAHDLSTMCDDNIRTAIGGERIYIPVCNKEKREARICEKRLAGITYREIAKQEGMTTSGIFKICQRYGV